MNYQIRVDDHHFQYLRIQKGNLDNLARNRERWHAEYARDLERQFSSFVEYLPSSCARFLDVGSGLGGIDILIRRHYDDQGQAPVVVLMDGERDPPQMNLHRETFNDMGVACDFQEKNGLPPARFDYRTPRSIWPGIKVPCDLVVSFGSWCFHFPPSTYLPAICNGGIVPGETIAVLEVRRNKANWWRELTAVFQPVAKVAEKEKWERWVFRARQK